MDFEIDANDAHSPEQWILHSTPLVPIAQKQQ
jgi:hypothetical protein